MEGKKGAEGCGGRMGECKMVRRKTEGMYRQGKEENDGIGDEYGRAYFNV